MANIIGTVEDYGMKIAVSGRIDSSNAKEVETAMEKELEGKDIQMLVLDAEELDYLSSAGLRILLKLKKKYPDFKVIGVSSTVYEIFDMTGFTEMITIEKAYRKISVEGCEVIGQGSNGLVYRIDPDTIVKVYKNPDSLAEIHNERELARKAFVMGIPTAIPYDVVRVGSSYGSVFERLTAKSFAKLTAANPDKVDDYIHMSVDLLKSMHETQVKPGELPDMRETAIGYAEFLEKHLPEASASKLRALIEAVPACTNMMHGDYHFKNVMLQDGEPLLIDMDTLCVGNPVFEFASIYNAYVGFGVLDHREVSDFIGIPYETACEIWEKTVKEYFGCEDISEYLKKAQLMGYVRILRRAIKRRSGEKAGQELIAYLKGEVIRLIDEVDSLEY